MGSGVDCPPDVQRPFVVVARAGVVSTCADNDTEVVERAREIRVVGRKSALADRQRLGEHRFRILQPSLVEVEDAEATERLRNVQRARGEISSDRESPFQQALRSLVVAERRLYAA